MKSPANASSRDLHDTAEQARQKHKTQVNAVWNRDGGSRSPIVASQYGILLATQNRLPTNECGQRGEHEVAYGARYCETGELSVSYERN